MAASSRRHQRRPLPRLLLEIFDGNIVLVFVSFDQTVGIVGEILVSLEASDDMFTEVLFG